MILRPALKGHLLPLVIGGEGVVLVSERRQILLTGAVYEQLVPLLDGTRTTDDIIAALHPDIPPADVYYALLRLQDQGHIRDRSAAPDATDEAYWDEADIDPGLAHERLEAARVEMCSIEVPDDLLTPALEIAGIRPVPQGEILLVQTDDYGRSELEAINRTALADRRAWLLLKPVGTQITVGPLFVPSRTGCWACLAHRLKRNDAIASFARTRGGNGCRPAPSSPSIRALAANLAVTELVTWLGSAAGSTRIEGAMLTLDTHTMTLMRHALTRRPQCSACGDDRRYARQVMQPVTLSLHTGGGVDPKQNGFAHLVDPKTGVVHHLAAYPTPDSGPLHVWTATSGSVMGRTRLADVRRDLLHQTSGKGTSAAQARAAALGEAVERYSTVWQGDEPTRRASLAELGDPAVDPRELLLFSSTQYRLRVERNANAPPSARIPEPFDEAIPIDWTPVWSLTTSRHRWVPTSYLYFGHPDAGRPGFCRADSNGCAAGPSLEHAVLGGLLELVERDAVALWWYNRARRPGVTLAHVDDEFVTGFWKAMVHGGRETWALDITTDVGIPTFVAVSRFVDRPAESILLGFGCHPDPALALRHACAELGQMHAATSTFGTTDTIVEPEVQRWLSTATVAEHEYLSPHTTDATIPRPGPPAPRAAADALGLVLDAIDRVGHDVLVLDLTRPDIGMPVARAIVPGFRHFWPRFAPGRLTAVPARLGWVTHPLDETDLNPVAMFL